MAENSLVVSSHGLSATELASWFSEHHCELASCRKTGAVELSDECLVELVLENSTDIAEHVFISNFPSGTVRRVCPSEHHDDSLQANVSLTHCLGGVDVKINLRGGHSNDALPSVSRSLKCRSVVSHLGLQCLSSGVSLCLSLEYLSFVSLLVVSL